jgi:hypothetical protein
VDLPAFLLSKNFYSESIGMPVGRTYDRAFNNACVADAANNRVGACLVGLTGSLCANSPSSSAYLSFR